MYTDIDSKRMSTMTYLEMDHDDNRLSTATEFDGDNDDKTNGVHRVELHDCNGDDRHGNEDGSCKTHEDVNGDVDNDIDKGHVNIGMEVCVEVCGEGPTTIV